MAENWGNHVAIAVDGVLRQPNDSSVIIAGLLIYKSLVKDHRVSLIFDTSTREKTQYWLLMNGMTDHVGEIYWETHDPEDTVARRLKQVARLRVDGPLSAVYESNTEVAAKLLEAGIPTFLFLHPQFTHPEFRPDHQPEPTPWSEMVEEMRRQREAKAQDIRPTDF